MQLVYSAAPADWANKTVIAIDFIFAQTIGPQTFCNGDMFQI